MRTEESGSTGQQHITKLLFYRNKALVYNISAKYAVELLKIPGSISDDFFRALLQVTAQRTHRRVIKHFLQCKFYAYGMRFRYVFYRFQTVAAKVVKEIVSNTRFFNGEHLAKHIAKPFLKICLRRNVLLV